MSVLSRARDNSSFLAKLAENGSSRGQAEGFRVDTGDESEVAGGLQHALRTFGPPEILVNGSEHKTIRRRETYDDLIAPEQLSG